MPDTFSQRIDASLAKLPAGALVVGFSGGSDSTVLLHLLAHAPAARARGLRALHVDHGLHADSARWAAHCRAVCAKLGVTLAVATVRVDAAGDGPEAAARRARWQAYAEQVGDAEILVLAHHRDDQAETVLLRLLRGAGARGLSAMRPFARRRGLRVWRPLLATPRAALRDYAAAHGLQWLEDPANVEFRYDRSYLRTEVMPRLRVRWPQADRAIAQTAERMADARMLERDAGAVLLAQAATIEARRLAWPPLAAAKRSLRWATLRLWLRRAGLGDVGAARLARIDAELIGAGVDADPRLVIGGKALRRYREHLYLLDADADAALDYRIDWNGRAPLALPDGIGTLAIEPATAVDLPLVVASRRGGERLRLHPGGPSRELKHLLQEQGVPPWLRARWPVLWLDGEPAGFADLLLDVRLRARLDALGARLRFIG